MHRFFSPVLLTLALSSFPGCSDDTDGGEPATNAAGDTSADGGAEDAEAATDCPARCADKAAACGAPAEVAGAQCQGICGTSLTEDQLSCLEDEDCGALEGLIFGSADVCGIGGGSASGGSASGSSGSPTPMADADIGDPCECSNSGAGFESCSGTGSECGELTCYVFDGEGICSQTCTADIDGDDCPSLECTEHILNGVTVGTWCAF